MKSFRLVLLILSILPGFSLAAPMSNDVATQNAILAALPDNVTAATATADQLAQAALEVAFGVDNGKAGGLTQKEMETNLTQVMVSLGEMTRAGKFPNAPRFGNKNPPGRLYTRVLNVASSNLDVASTTYYGTTVQYIIGLTAAMREGQNFLNGAKSNAITRK